MIRTKTIMNHAVENPLEWQSETEGADETSSMNRRGRNSGVYSRRVFYLVLFLFFFAPFVSMLLYTVTGVKVIAALPVLIRDSIVFLSFAAVLFARAMVKGRCHTTLIYFCVLLVAIILATAGNAYSSGGSHQAGELIKVLLNNLRRFVFPFLIFIYFYYFLDRKSIGLACKFAMTFWCFGIFEYFMPLSFWSSLGLLNYWNEYSNSTASTGKIQESLAGYDRLFTFDTYYILGFQARRLISFYLEPTTTAALAQATVILGLLTKKRLLVTLAVVGGLLTFSKGFILFLLGLLPLSFLINRVHRNALRLYLIAVACVLFGSLVIGYFVYLQYPQIVKIGLFAHLEGLYEYIVHFNPLGYGVGIVGSFRFEDSWGGELHRVGVESSLANHVSQLGLLGLAAILMLFWHIKNLMGHSKQSFYVLYMLTMYCFIFSTSNSATGYSGNFFIFFVLVAWYKYLRINPVMFVRPAMPVRSAATS
jgi:hypothetical protein